MSTSRHQHTSEFDAFPVVGQRASGISRGTVGRRRYETRWSGIYEGVQASEWTGEPVHAFRDGIIGDTPQGHFAVPLANFAREPVTAEEARVFAIPGHEDCPGRFAFYERLPHATVFACPQCGQHRVAQDDPAAHAKTMGALADALIDAAENFPEPE